MPSLKSDLSEIERIVSSALAQEVENAVEQTRGVIEGFLQNSTRHIAVIERVLHQLDRYEGMIATLRKTIENKREKRRALGGATATVGAMAMLVGALDREIERLENQLLGLYSDMDAVADVAIKQISSYLDYITYTYSRELRPIYQRFQTALSSFSLGRTVYTINTVLAYAETVLGEGGREGEEYRKIITRVNRAKTIFHRDLMGAYNAMLRILSLILDELVVTISQTVVDRAGTSSREEVRKLIKETIAVKSKVAGPKEKRFTYSMAMAHVPEMLREGLPAKGESLEEYMDSVRRKRLIISQVVGAKTLLETVLRSYLEELEGIREDLNSKLVPAIVAVQKKLAEAEIRYALYCPRFTCQASYGVIEYLLRAGGRYGLTTLRCPECGATLLNVPKAVGKDIERVKEIFSIISHPESITKEVRRRVEELVKAGVGELRRYTTREKVSDSILELVSVSVPRITFVAPPLTITLPGGGELTLSEKQVEDTMQHIFLRALSNLRRRAAAILSTKQLKAYMEGIMGYVVGNRIEFTIRPGLPLRLERGFKGGYLWDFINPAKKLKGYVMVPIDARYAMGSNEGKAKASQVGGYRRPPVRRTTIGGRSAITYHAPGGGAVTINFRAMEHTSEPFITFTEATGMSPAEFRPKPVAYFRGLSASTAHQKFYIRPYRGVEGLKYLNDYFNRAVGYYFIRRLLGPKAEKEGWVFPERKDDFTLKGYDTDQESLLRSVLSTELVQGQRRGRVQGKQVVLLKTIMARYNLTEEEFFQLVENKVYRRRRVDGVVEEFSLQSQMLGGGEVKYTIEAKVIVDTKYLLKTSFPAYISTSSMPLGTNYRKYRLRDLSVADLINALHASTTPSLRQSLTGIINLISRKAVIPKTFAFPYYTEELKKGGIAARHPKVIRKYITNQEELERVIDETIAAILSEIRTKMERKGVQRILYEDKRLLHALEDALQNLAARREFVEEYQPVLEAVQEVLHKVLER